MTDSQSDMEKSVCMLGYLWGKCKETNKQKNPDDFSTQKTNAIIFLLKKVITHVISV